jgi:hypothetical protein
MLENNEWPSAGRFLIYSLNLVRPLELSIEEKDLGLYLALQVYDL